MEAIKERQIKKWKEDFDEFLKREKKEKLRLRGKRNSSNRSGEMKDSRPLGPRKRKRGEHSHAGGENNSLENTDGAGSDLEDSAYDNPSVDRTLHDSFENDVRVSRSRQRGQRITRADLSANPSYGNVEVRIEDSGRSS